MEKETITVKENIQAAKQKAWDYYTRPEHITNWNFATDEWHCPRAESNLQPGGRFLYRMEAKDGSAGFDFEGIFDEITPGESLNYTMSDGRKARVEFSDAGEGAGVTVDFEADAESPVDMQKAGWQAILTNFKEYTETH